MGELVRALLDRLPVRFRWTLHNLVAHPVGEVLWQLGLERADGWLHDATMPTHEPGQGHG